MRITLRRTFAATGTALALALPMQAGVAHASTPNEDLSACIATTISTYNAAIVAGTDFDVSTAIDGCVDAYLRDMGIDPATGMISTPDTSVGVDPGTNVAVDAGSAGTAGAAS